MTLRGPLDGCAQVAGDQVVFAFLPSPSTNVVHLEPLTLHMYGLSLLAGIMAALWVTRRRWTRMGGDGDLVYRVGLWGVGFGIVGARLYHVATSWTLVPDPKWQGVFEVWNGGLGIWGGVLFGCAAGALVVRHAGASVRSMLDAAARGLLLAHLGFRLNFFVSLTVLAASSAFFVWWQFLRPASELPTSDRLAGHA